MPTYRINVGVTYQGNGGPAVNTWHCRTDALQTADVQNLVDILQTFYTGLQGIYATSTTVSCPSEVIVDPYGQPEYLAVEGWSLNGTAVNSSMPPSNQICVTWRTTAATRSGRGRTFLGPLSVIALQTNGTISPDALDDVNAACAALVSASESGLNGAFGVYSRTDGVLRDFVGSAVRDQFAVLRSRRD